MGLSKVVQALLPTPVTVQAGGGNASNSHDQFHAQRAGTPTRSGASLADVGHRRAAPDTTKPPPLAGA